MTLTILADNLSEREGLETEHGLAFYIESGQYKILFDTGQSGAFLHNAMKLNLDISQVNYLVLSHGHYDHTGGIKEFLKINNQALIIHKAKALDEKYNSHRYIGIEKGLHLPSQRTVVVHSHYKIVENISVVGHINITDSKDTHFENFFIQENSNQVADTFEDELFMVFETHKGLILLSGCSHHGIINMIDTAKMVFKKKVNQVFGGFHLKDSSKPAVLRTGRFLAGERINKIVTCHCTGYENFKTLKQEELHQLEYGFVGNTYTC